MSTFNWGIIGCGAISGIYIQNTYRFPHLRLAALADLDASRPPGKIEEIKAKFNTEWNLPGTPQLPRAAPISDILADPSIHGILNLTVPKVHAEVSRQILSAGKHLYSEKPLAISRDDSAGLLQLASRKNLLIGCAPDTFLGAALQSARKLLDDGWIGTPLGCTAFMTCPGHESWHPDPEFYYQQGGGPLFDMGPYYLTALVHLLGPVKRVACMARATYPTRTITSPKKSGTQIPVETPTHIATTLEFASGPIGTMLMSFDVFGANLPRLEIYGTRGTLSLPDPNNFSGDIKIKLGRNDWAPIPLTHGYKENFRALGAADLAAATTQHRPARASGQLAHHVVDIMQSSLQAAEQSLTLTLQSTCERPSPLPLGLRDGQLD